MYLTPLIFILKTELNIFSHKNEFVKILFSFRILDLTWSKHLNWWVSSRQDIVWVGPVLNGLLSLSLATSLLLISFSVTWLRSWFLTWNVCSTKHISLAAVPSCYTYQRRNVQAISHNQKLQTYQHFRVGLSLRICLNISPLFNRSQTFKVMGWKTFAWRRNVYKNCLFCISKHYHSFTRLDIIC